MERYYFDNGFGTSLDRDLRFLSYPEIDRGSESVTQKTIPGRKGTLTIRTGTFSDTTITCSLHLERDLETLERAYLETKLWLEKTKKISFSDNPWVFYRVKKTEVGKQSKAYGRFGTFDVVFICNPGEYIPDGLYEYDAYELCFNPYSECCPIYKIQGNGSCRIVVNGNWMQAEVTGDLTIDTDLEIAYSKEGSKNTTVSGDYEDLYLMEGDNKISISDGFKLKIIPNWRIL